MKKTPTAMMKMQMVTLMMTRAFVTRADSLAPIIAMSPSSTAMRMPPTLTVDVSPKRASGRLNSDLR